MEWRRAWAPWKSLGSDLRLPHPLDLVIRFRHHQDQYCCSLHGYFDYHSHMCALSSEVANRCLLLSHCHDCCTAPSYESKSWKRNHFCLDRCCSQSWGDDLCRSLQASLQEPSDESPSKVQVMGTLKNHPWHRWHCERMQLHYLGPASDSDPVTHDFLPKTGQDTLGIECCLWIIKSILPDKGVLSITLSIFHSGNLRTICETAFELD